MPESNAELMRMVRERLQALEPIELQLEDQSARHAGHAGARAGAHLALNLVSARFTGLARLARHRLVHEAMADLLPGRIHALALNLRAPGEPPAPAA